MLLRERGGFSLTFRWLRFIRKLPQVGQGMSDLNNHVEQRRFLQTSLLFLALLCQLIPDLLKGNLVESKSLPSLAF